MQKLNFQKPNTITQAFGLPNMSQTLNGWEQSITLVKIKQDIVEGDAVFTKEEISFQGVVQPFSVERLQSLAEGQRSWEWYWIHAKASALNLQTADKIEYNGKRFKVMTVKDYSAYGYIEYEIIRDYESNPTNE